MIIGCFSKYYHMEIFLNDGRYGQVAVTQSA
jgi:hypothetical protein